MQISIAVKIMDFDENQSNKIPDGIRNIILPQRYAEDILAYRYALIFRWCITINDNEAKLFARNDSMRKNKIGALQMSTDFLKLKMPLQGASYVFNLLTFDDIRELPFTVKLVRAKFNKCGAFQQ